MHMLKIWPVLALLATTAALAQEKAPVLRLHGFLESLEIAPVLLAADRHYPAGISLKRGGIQNLYGVVSPAYGDAGTADVATNAETQLLRYSVAHPELRAIMTVTEGRYRIVARRSAGIVQLRDLRGKRVGTLPNTSAAYFLERMLGSAGLAPSDVVTVGNIDLPELSAALVDGRIDALAMWSPESEEAEMALGKDAVGFDGAGIYREIQSQYHCTGAGGSRQTRCDQAAAQGPDLCERSNDPRFHGGSGPRGQSDVGVSAGVFAGSGGGFLAASSLRGGQGA